MKDGDESSVQVHVVQTDSKAGEILYGHLRPKAAATTKNIGEDVAIAFAAVMDPDAVFVTMDRAAAYVALAELGPGRLALPFDLWAYLLGQNYISSGQHDRLVERTWKGGLPGVPWRLRPGSKPK